MRTSVWLQNYEKEVQDKQAKGNKSKNTVYIMVPAVFLLFVVLMIVNGALKTPEGRQGVYIVLGLLVFVMLIVMVSMRAAKKKDLAEYTRNSVQELLTRDEDVELFDQQMSMAPEFEAQVNTERFLFMTKDFVGERFMYGGIQKYRFCHRRDVKSFHYIKEHKTNMLITDFDYDVRNAYNEVVLNGTTSGKKKLEAIQDFFAKVCPDLEIIKEKRFGL